MASLEEMLGLDPQSPEMLRAEFLVENDRALLRRLIEVRKSRGLTQEQVGELMGVSQPTVAKFEAYDSNPRLSTVRRYAHAVRALVDHIVEPDSGQLLDSSWQRVQVSQDVLLRMPLRADLHFVDSSRITAALVDSFRGEHLREASLGRADFSLAA